MAVGCFAPFSYCEQGCQEHAGTDLLEHLFSMILDFNILKKERSEECMHVHTRTRPLSVRAGSENQAGRLQTGDTHACAH